MYGELMAGAMGGQCLVVAWPYKWYCLEEKIFECCRPEKGAVIGRNMSSQKSVRSNGHRKHNRQKGGEEDRSGVKRKDVMVESAREDENGDPTKRSFSLNGTIIAPPRGGSNGLIGPQESGSSGNSTATASSLTAVSANSSWSLAREAGMNDGGRLHMIKKFVKDQLFPHVKFVTGKTQMRWETAPGSIAQFVLKGLNVMGEQEYKRDWWENYRDMISKELNRKRSDVVSGIKKVFLGKCVGNAGRRGASSVV
jgi:hypothetical protein